MEPGRRVQLDRSRLSAAFKAPSTIRARSQNVCAYAAHICLRVQVLRHPHQMGVQHAVHTCICMHQHAAHHRSGMASSLQRLSAVFVDGLTHQVEHAQPLRTLRASKLLYDGIQCPFEWLNVNFYGLKVRKRIFAALPAVGATARSG